MLDRLGRGDQAGVQRVRALVFLQDFVALSQDALDGLAGLALARLPMISKTCCRRSIWPSVSS